MPKTEDVCEAKMLLVLSLLTQDAESTCISAVGVLLTTDCQYDTLY